MTSSSEARVPHDPRYLRAAAKVVNDSRTTVRTADGGALADRLEAWADDVERLAPLEAAVLDAAKGAIGSYPRSPAQKELNEALRALQEATLEFWTKVDKTDSCWLWMGPRTFDGYGHFWDGTKSRRAHRIAYEQLVGPIPEGLVIDHMCRTPCCVNPAHLQAVTQRENVLRSLTGTAAVNARKTHCIRGHEFTPENTYEQPGQPGTRQCRECKRLHVQGGTDGGLRQTNVQLPVDLHRAVRERAATEGRPITDLIRHALRAYLGSTDA